ncbi:MAG: glycosyltransferase family 4 protein [Candidatus Pacebacteria bacterium]|nr:glycosyltransferase family 4 protein [Candidatus Paceibacterota bacterium]
MRILIASGIYPPDIGGPAQYARNLYETWKGAGNDVKVAAYRWERAFPPLVRHILFFLKIIRKGWNADLILVLDTWSAAVPAMYACKIMRKKYLIRTGGDFLWETYTERTGDLVLLKDFYSDERGAREGDEHLQRPSLSQKKGFNTLYSSSSFKEKLSRKERMIFKLGGDALRGAAKVIFSTEWQKGIFEKAYGLDPRKNAIVENYCGEREPVVEPENRMFVAGTRPLKWKNADFLKECFTEAQDSAQRLNFAPIELDCGKAVYDSFLEKIHRSYAVILVSLGDISPNMIFDAVKCGTPFIVTEEIGIKHLLDDAALYVNPKDKKAIVDKIVWLSDPANRAAQAEKVRRLAFTHSWAQIGEEIIAVSEKP